MDTIILITLIVAVVVIIILRLVFRSYRLRQASNENQQPEKPISSLEMTTPTAENTPPEIEARAERLEATHPPDKAIPIVHHTPTHADAGLEKAVEVFHLYKSFGGREVVKDVSFSLATGEVFGLVGPNGAGKTTTIRMLMDIIKPDSGGIRLFGQPLNEDAKNRIGYLPEERGLYRRMTVFDSLVYLASLKNIETRVAKERAEELLKQVNMFPHQGKKISELSRGMGQIIQFVVTIAHNPDLIVLDEPFAGLDPINRQLLKDIVLNLREQGKTIILSTHMINEVEEMCDRIMMIDQGLAVLYGELAEIKWRYRNNSVFVECDGDIGELAGVSGRQAHGKHVELFLEGETPPQAILGQLIEKNIMVNRFEVSTPSLNEIFIQVVQNRR